jgi:hypothetical protein
MTLKFKEWEKLNEESIFTSIKNWFSGNFGGDVSKLDDLLYRYKKAHIAYQREWEDVVTEIDALQVKRETKATDVAEDKAISRMIERKKQFLDSIKNKQNSEIKSSQEKAEKIISGNKRLKDYWEKSKLEIDVEISKKLYDIAKDLSDTSLESELYTKYKKDLDGYLEVKKRFVEKYSETKKKTVKADPDDISRIVRMSLGEFDKEVKTITPEQARELAKACTEERNKLYVEMDLKIDQINKELGVGTKGIEEIRDEVAKRISAVKKEYLEKIREYRTKITLAKRKAS